MKKLFSKYSNYFYIVPWSIIFIGSIFAISQNIGRGIVVICILLAWLLIALKYKFSLEIFFYTLLISSLNITITFSNFGECFVKGVYVNYLCPTVHILDIVMVLNLLLFFALEVIKIKRISEAFKSFKILIPFYIYSVVHIIIHSDLVSIISMLRLNLYLSLIPPFVLVIKTFVNEKKVNKKYFKNFVYLVSILLIQLIIGIFQFTKGRDIGLQLLGESNLLSGTINTSFMSNSLGLFLRSYGTFPHPNILGGFALLIGILGYIFFFEKKKSYYFILLLVSGLIIALTFSRTAIVLYAVLLVFSVYDSFKGRVFGVLPLFFDRFINLNLGETSIVDRVNLMKTAWIIFKDNWLIGIGNGNFISKLGGFNVTTTNGLSLLQPVHNIFILVFVEHGLIGGLFTLIFLGYLKVKESISWINNKGLFIYTIFVILLVGMLDHYLLTLPQGIFIFSLLFMI